MAESDVLVGGIFPSVTIPPIRLPVFLAFSAPQISLANPRPFFPLYEIPRRVRNNYWGAQKQKCTKKGKTVNCRVWIGRGMGELLQSGVLSLASALF